VRRDARIALAAALCSFLGLLSAGLAGGCGADAVAIDACRRIETARCEASTACGLSQEESTYCLALYRDQCLHGIQNKTGDPDQTMVDACVAAVRATEACVRAGAQSMAECAAAPLVASQSPAAIAPCTVIQRKPEWLSACSFVASDEDAGTATIPSDASDADAD